MELVVRVKHEESLAAALEAGVAGVALSLAGETGEEGWRRAEKWQAAARQRGSKFYLVWDWLVRDFYSGERKQAQSILEAVGQMKPDALVVRDMGVFREARRRYPNLRLHAALNWGCLNSPGMRLAEKSGFGRALVSGRLGLKDLALMRRQSSLPLEVALPDFCPGFAHLCLLKEYLGWDCETCPALTQGDLPEIMAGAVEMLSGLYQLGIEAVQAGGEFTPGESLGQFVDLCRVMGETSPAARSKVRAAAHQVLTAWRERFKEVIPQAGPKEGRTGMAGGGRDGAGFRRPPELPEEVRLWLEARDYPEAAALAREWREPLVVQLTPENFGAFLPEHRRWQGRRLIWRLPPVIRESALAFYRKALETLRHGGYRRFIAGDWGGVALVRESGGEVYGDQTLGIRNSGALDMARDLGVAKVCLPPGRPQEWRSLLNYGPPGSFWGYLHHFPALAIWPREAVSGRRWEQGPAGEKLRWVVEGDLAVLCREVPERLVPGAWLQERRVGPLILALPRSGLPWGQAPRLRRGRPRV
jgi:collagenase-like PrtC family protease